jgi:glutathione S-transferase
VLAFTLAAAQTVGMLDERFPRLRAYRERLQQRPASLTAVSG